MPPLVEEKFGSPRLGTDSAESYWIITGTDDEFGAKASLLFQLPTSLDGIPLQNAQVEQIAPLIWEGTANYGLQQQQPPQAGQSVFNFDTSGGTQHISQALQNIANHAPSGETAPDYKGAIGVTFDSVEGVDITVPVYTFSETHYLAASAVDNAYKATLYFLTGKVNSGGFKGTAAGECLFLGATGTRRGTSSEDDWEINYRFAASPNRSGITIGTITGINKKGWEYLWVRYEDVEDTAAKVLVKRPASVHVERVYESGDFSALGIGT